MKPTLPSSSLSGVYTRFEIKDTVTGVVRTYEQAPNEITEQGLIMFGSDDPKWHQFNRCLLSRRVLSEGDVSWGEIIPTNSNPDDPLCADLVASEINDSYHADVTKDDDYTNLFFIATKSWTFRQGIVGEFNMVVSGHMESTEDVPEDSDPLRPVDELDEPCPLTGDEEYQNWKLYPISLALIPGITLNLTATDILTVTHQLRINLPKYQPVIMLDNIMIGRQGYVFNARPYVPAYDALIPTDTPLTDMRYCDSSEMTGGLIPGIRQSITDGDWDTVGETFIIGEGDYTSTQQPEYTVNEGEDDEEVIRSSVIEHTLTLNPGDGQGRVGYLLINGCRSWYEIEIVPPIPKRDVDKLSLVFSFSWG